MIKRPSPTNVENITFVGLVHAFCFFAKWVIDRLQTF